MGSPGSVLPSFQRYVNGVPVPMPSRRGFRPREKYLICFMFLTFMFVCFGTFLFLPDLKSSNISINKVIIKHVQNVGPELLLPPPLLLNEMNNTNSLRHGLKNDIHRIDDEKKLLEKIKLDLEKDSQKVLEKPNLLPEAQQKQSSKPPAEEFMQQNLQENEVLAMPIIQGGVPNDMQSQERRLKIKEVGYS